MERLDLRGGPILSHADIKSIFGNTPEILSVHRRLVVSLVLNCSMMYLLSSHDFDFGAVCHASVASAATVVGNKQSCQQAATRWWCYLSWTRKFVSI